MTIKIEFNRAPVSARKLMLRRSVALLALLCLITAMPASAKYVSEGGVVFSMELDSMALSAQAPITLSADGEIGITPRAWIPDYAAGSSILASGTSSVSHATSRRAVTANGFVIIDSNMTTADFQIQINSVTIYNGGGAFGANRREFHMFPVKIDDTVSVYNNSGNTAVGWSIRFMPGRWIDF